MRPRVAIASLALLVAACAAPSPPQAAPAGTSPDLVPMATQGALMATPGPASGAPSGAPATATETAPYASGAGPGASSNLPATASGLPVGSLIPSGQSVGPTWPPGVGFAMGVASPVPLGGQASVRATVFAGPTCSLAVVYPGGGRASFPSHTFTVQQTWTWDWTVPGSAGYGTAQVSVACSYGGLTKTGQGSFVIPAPATPTSKPTQPPPPGPTPPPSWTLHVTAVSPVHSNGGAGWLSWSGSASVVPNVCNVHADPPGVTRGYFQIYPTSTALQFQVQIDVAYANATGLWTWEWDCWAGPSTAPSERIVTGTIDVLP